MLLINSEYNYIKHYKLNTNMINDVYYVLILMYY